MTHPQMPMPLFLEASAPPAFAFMHPATGEQARRRAVLLCPPFGWDDMCSYRSRRDWAELLAARGYPTLRLDLPGSGDSAGGPADPGQLSAWTHAVTDATHWLLDNCDATGVTAIGIGLGGMIACQALIEGAPIEELVLWNVPAKGRALTRALRAFSAMEVAYIPDADAPATAAPTPEGPASDAASAVLENNGRPQDGAIVANGYLLSAETVTDLSRLDLGAPWPAQRIPRRALLLERDGLKVDERLRESLEQAGAALTVANGIGYGAMMIEPQDALPPKVVFELVGSWLDRGELDDGERQAPPFARSDASTGVAADAHTPVTAHHQLELECGEGRLRETPIYVDGPEGPLFGILAEPLGERQELCAVLVNAGPQRRTGPSRLWVEIARRWAAQGVPTLRIDLGGIGDSDGDAASLVHVASLYSPAFVRQARAVLDALGERGLPQRFLIMGLCAGAYWSTHTTLQDERIGTLVMLNPRTLIWDPWIYGVRRTRELRERLLMASTWRKALRGELTLARHVETARALASRAARSPRTARERLSGSEHRGGRREALADIFDRLRERDQRTVMLFTGAEPLHRELTAMGLLEQLDRWPNMSVTVRGTAADTHTLTPLWLQAEVHQLVDRALAEELGRVPGVRPA